MPLVVTTLLLCQGCGGHRNVYVLLANPDGTTGKIAVSNPAGERTLQEAQQAVAVENAQEPPGEPFRMEEAQIRKIFGPALDAQPPQPARFTLYFLTDSVELTGESRALIQDIIEAFRKRGSMDISVTGHTDTVGDKNYNYELSLKRAEAVGNLLISRGVDPAYIEITSHGKENPAIPTGDNVAEPRNRRVEVTVR